MIRWYISPYIGTGIFPDSFRTAIDDLIHNGEQADGTDHPQRRYFIRRVDASQATHDAIINGGHGIPFTELAETETLDNTHASLDVSLKNQIVAECANRGIDISWVAAATTKRQFLRRMIQLCWLAQKALGEKHEVMKAILNHNLDAPVSEFTAQQRNAVKTWMENKGLDTGWIKNVTTIREIIAFILNNLNLKVKFKGQEF